MVQKKLTSYLLPQIFIIGTPLENFVATRGVFQIDGKTSILEMESATAKVVSSTMPSRFFTAAIQKYC